MYLAWYMGFGNPSFSAISYDHGLVPVVLSLHGGMQISMKTITAALEDGRTLSDHCNIQKEHPFPMVHSLREGMQIFMKTLPGKTIIYAVQALDTIDNVKARVQDVKGIPPLQQYVLFADKQFKAGRNFSEADIQKELTVYSLPGLRGGMPIFGKTVPSKTIILDVKTSDMIATDRFVYLMRLRGGMQFFLKTVATALTQLCLPGGMQIFAKTLTAIYLESTFQLVPRLRGGMHIYALEGKTTTLDAEASDTTANVQAKIPCDKTIITVRQCVALAGKQLENDLHLVLQLCEGMPIFVKPLTPIIEFQTNLMPNPRIPSM